MSSMQVSAEDVSILYTSATCCDAVFALLVYDWLLCFDREVSFIWKWHSRVTVSSLLYGLSRYTLLIRAVLAVVESYPMSDASCTANIWTQIAAQILGTAAFSAFSALRAYALSNKNRWLAFIILLLALPPLVIAIIQGIYETPLNLPSPYNCGSSNSMSPMLSTSITLVFRGPQLAAELLVVGITWWYTYQSYRIRRGIKLEKATSISSLLFYNGSLYFLFLASWYVIEIILDTAPVPAEVTNAYDLMDLFCDPITSILVCRFMISIREFDSANASTTRSLPGSRVREHMASTVLEFGAQSSHRLPAFIASFAHPVHVDPALSATDHDLTTIDDEFELESRETGFNAEAEAEAIPETQSTSARSPALDQCNSRIAVSTGTSQGAS